MIGGFGNCFLFFLVFLKFSRRNEKSSFTRPAGDCHVKRRKQKRWYLDRNFLRDPETKHRTNFSVVFEQKTKIVFCRNEVVLKNDK